MQPAYREWEKWLFLKMYTSGGGEDNRSAQNNKQKTTKAKRPKHIKIRLQKHSLINEQTSWVSAQRSRCSWITWWRIPTNIKAMEGKIRWWVQGPGEREKQLFSGYIVPVAQMKVPEPCYAAMTFVNNHTYTSIIKRLKIGCFRVVQKTWI